MSTVENGNRAPHLTAALKAAEAAKNVNDRGMPILSAAEKESLETRLALPLRPNTGVLGRGVKLNANYFTVDTLPTGELIHYDVAVTPDVPAKVRRTLFKVVEATYGQSEFGGRSIGYDGMANLFSLGSLPKSQYTLTVEAPRRRPDDVQTFTFVIKRVAVISMETLKAFLDGKLSYTPQQVITALEVIMRHPIAQSDAVTVGRSIFSGRAVEPICGGVDVWRGFFLSLRPSLGRLLLNVDTSTGAFITPGPVIDVLREFLGVAKSQAFESIHPKEAGPIETYLRVCRVEATHRGEENRRRYKVLGLTKTGVAETYFEDETGKKTSVAQYFAATYNMKLAFPRLPCLVVGSPQRSVYLPMECCRIPPGQQYMRKLDGNQTADMIKIANRPPSERLGSIQRSVAILGEHKNYLDAFKLTFGQQVVPVNGRILPPPTVFYGKESREAEITPAMGAWNLRDKRVEVGATIESWAVLVFGRADPKEVQAFVRELVITCEDTGVRVNMKNPPLVVGTGNVEASVDGAYEKASQACSAKPQFILVVLPTDDAGLYGDIKRHTDTHIGLPSQCMLMKHVRRPNKQYCANLCLKINVKLGGVNSSLGRQLPFIVERPTMVFGADVTHPGIGEGEGKPSIAAVVGSMDIKLSRYAASVRTQGSRVEIIADIREMFKEQIAHFVAANRVKPQRILFYRDGVSEGQFAQVLNFELAAIKEAAREIHPDYNPTITFILVQKRHHTRFFTTSDRDADRSGNVQAGTVVDTGVVHPNQFDFFLCSHGGLQGTSRPAHYHVVHDENAFTADALQTMSYLMCYTFARCTRSVSIVTPVYYAHLVAFRARFHFDHAVRKDRATFMPVKSELAPRMYFI